MLMNSKIQDTFLQLVRLGIRTSEDIPVLEGVDWQALEDLANEQGLLGVMLDGVDKFSRELRPEKKAIIQSIGQLVQTEQMYAVQEHAAAEMALASARHPDVCVEGGGGGGVLSEAGASAECGYGLLPAAGGGLGRCLGEGEPGG